VIASSFTASVRVVTVVVIRALVVVLLVVVAVTVLVRAFIINVEVFVDANRNLFAGVMTAFEFAMAGPLDEICC